MATVSVADGSGSTVALQAKPSNVARPMTSNYVSSADLIASGDNTVGSFHKRDVDEQLIKRYGNQGITGLMELMGSKKELQLKLLNTMKKHSFTIPLQVL